MNNQQQVGWFAFMPAFFVLLWSTGFIGAKYGLPHAGPLSFLAVRYVVVIALLGLVALWARAPWPSTPMDRLHAIISGILIHGVYLGGVFIAINLGMSAGMSALIVGLQPLLTAVLSGFLLGERVTSRHWFGILLGLLGVSLVLLPRIQDGGTLSLAALAAALCALFGITLGTIYQKAFAVQLDLRTGGVLQYLGALIPTGIAAYLIEGFDVTWTWEFVGALLWLVLVLSIGAISLLMLIIRHGEITKIATLFYLVPPVTVLIAYVLFHETLNLLQGAGIAIVVLAVWMTSSVKTTGSADRVISKNKDMY